MREIIETYRQKGLRRKLVEELVSKGIKDRAILEAIGKLPRHCFLDSAFETMAYKDIAFPIGFDQTISQPYTVAVQTMLLKVAKGDRILEIGTGSGYQACILSLLGAKVVTIERQIGLYNKTTSLLKGLEMKHIYTILGDGFEGDALSAPYDKILITAAAPEIPNKLVSQLKIGGFLVLPLSRGAEFQQMIRLTKISATELKEEDFGRFSFVPMLGGVVE